MQMLSGGGVVSTEHSLRRLPNVRGWSIASCSLLLFVHCDDGHEAIEGNPINRSIQTDRLPRILPASHLTERRTLKAIQTGVNNFDRLQIV